MNISENIRIGDDYKTFIIAEAGINHQGDINIAKELIKQAKLCGADCVKFQKRTIDKILTKDGLNKPYCNQNSFGKTYGEHKTFLEFSFSQFKELKNYSDEIGILFTASGWDEESVDFLHLIDVPFFKMASADLTNFPLLEHTAKKGKPIIISTGMSDISMVDNAYRLVSKFNKNIILMQCTSSYPAPFEELNLNVITTYKKLFPNAIIGYSGHEKGLAASLTACVLGAKVIERHFTLDRCMKGGDHASSLEPDGLSKLIRDIRVSEKSLGSYEKTIAPSEYACMNKLRKSLVSKCKIFKNQKITFDMLTVKGPGTGISPSEFNNLVENFTSSRDIEEDTVLEWNFFLQK